MNFSETSQKIFHFCFVLFVLLKDSVKSKGFLSILRHVADQLDYTKEEELENLYEKTAWYFDKKLKKKAAAYDVFKKAIRYKNFFRLLI